MPGDERDVGTEGRDPGPRTAALQRRWRSGRRLSAARPTCTHLQPFLSPHLRPRVPGAGADHTRGFSGYDRQ
ncbi:hypothetical protein GN956_G26302, partial [Arapaima gigas]